LITTTDLKSKLIKGLGLEDISVDEIDDEMPLFGEEGLGLDSVDAIEITLLVEKEFGVKIKDLGENSTVFSTPKTLTQYINENR
jgi:acyl carrier protein